MILEKIKKLCEKEKVSIYRLEKDLEFSPGSVSKWENSDPSLNKIAKVAKYFDVSIEYFLK